MPSRRKELALKLQRLKPTGRQPEILSPSEGPSVNNQRSTSDARQKSPEDRRSDDADDADEVAEPSPKSVREQRNPVNEDDDSEMWSRVFTKGNRSGSESLTWSGSDSTYMKTRQQS